MPIRLAHRVAELDNLPYELSSMPSVIKVRDWYAKSLQDLLEFPKAETFGVRSQLVDNKRMEMDGLLDGSLAQTATERRR